MAYCYILFSHKLNKYYIGACTNVERRLYEHNIGHSTFTKLGMPWILVYKEEFETLQKQCQELLLSFRHNIKYLNVVLSIREV